MDEKEQSELKIRYQQAIDQFIDKLKDDINVIAIILGGSVAYDVIWEKSDVDMTVVVRDQKLSSDNLSITEEGITFNLYLVQRSHFKRGMEGSIGGSFLQSFMAKGEIVYTTDESLYEFFEDVKQIGEDDRAISAFHITAEMLSNMHKVEKWIVARKDLVYAQYFFLKLAEQVAQMELCIRGIPNSRTAIQKAIELNPKIMKTFYQEPMTHMMTEEELTNGLQKLNSYLEEKIDLIKKPVIEYLSDHEIKTVSMIAKRLGSESHYIIDVLDYLAEKEVIDKVTQLIKLTPKSRSSIEEIGFLSI